MSVSAPTEERHPGTGALDAMSTLELLQTLNAEDALVAPAVQQVLPQLATAVDLTVDRIRRGGTVHYFGAGTSGRLAVIDAAELLPTFNAPEGLFVAHHAGGPARWSRRSRTSRTTPSWAPGTPRRSARATWSSGSPPPVARRTSPAPWLPPAGGARSRCWSRRTPGPSWPVPPTCCWPSTPAPR